MIIRKFLEKRNVTFLKVNPFKITLLTLMKTVSTAIKFYVAFNKETVFTLRVRCLVSHNVRQILIKVLCVIGRFACSLCVSSVCDIKHTHAHRSYAVSYTHLDVYKRQHIMVIIRWADLAEYSYIQKNK